jgi:exopolyphosphatase/guanosine-5'-triphosphate,3'-diphosphate pyrophosphatase
MTMTIEHALRQEFPANSDRVAVIDIGSNSVRLVVYGKNGAYPSPLFDERSNCQLGAGLDKAGTLAQDRIADALETLTRFRALIKAMKINSCYPIATAAVRRALNAKDFTEPASAILGQQITVLSEGEEADYVARGLTLNIPNVTGLVADLGGGSIEIVNLKNGELKNAISLNYGHLSDVSEAEIIKAISSVSWIAAAKAKQLFGVGGSFRALGQAYFAREKYPLPVLHGLKIDAIKATKLCDELARDGADMFGIPAARSSTMPMAATIIRSLMNASSVKRLVVSGTSIRDGVIASHELSATQRADFLVAVSEEIALASERFSGLSKALRKFLRPVALSSSTETLRLMEIACNLADICWHEHSDMRGNLAVSRVLALPINCITHKERVWLSIALYHRYVGLKVNKPRPQGLDGLLSKRKLNEAITVGLGLRFALIFAAGTGDYLEKMKLVCSQGKMTLMIDSSAKDFLDGHCKRRFEVFAESAGCQGEIIFT